MKKIFLSLMIFLCLGLFASCSEEEKTTVKSEQAYITAIFPKKLAVSQEGDVASHKLRCIVEIWSKGADAKLINHEEVVIAPAAQAEGLSFEFTLSEGNYDCLMWADYIDENASSGPKDATAFTHYPDKYYNTSDLKKITVKDVSKLINNEACDAFFYCGEMQKGGEALRQEIQLIRPFTKISVIEKNLREFNLLKGLDVSFDTYTGFDVSTGKVQEGQAKLSFREENFNPETALNGTVFTSYVFSNAESRNFGKIEMSFTTELGVQNVVVPEIIPLLRGQHIKVSGNMMAESPDPDTEYEISFDIDVEGWEDSDQTISTTKVKAKVGDFFYSDGTWSSTIKAPEATSATIVGIVFKVGADATDTEANYDNLPAINGYVVNISDITSYLGTSATGLAWCKTRTNADLSENVSADTKDYLGYKNTKWLLDNLGAAVTGVDNEVYPLFDIMIKNELPAVSGTNSGWYLPSAGQMETLYQVKSNLDTKFTEAGGAVFSPTSYWTTTYDSKNKQPFAFGFGDRGDGKPYVEVGMAKSIPSDRAFCNARLILTF